MQMNIGRDRWTTIHYGFLLILLAFLALYSGSEHHMRVRLQNDIFDFFNQLSPRPATDSIRIVDIDELSLSLYGQWPWPRTVLADLVNNLTVLGAKVIVFDGAFPEPDRTSPKYFLEHLPQDDDARDFFDQELKSKNPIEPDDMNNLFDHDAIFAAAIKESGRFVSGFTYGREDRTNARPVNKKRIQFADKKLEGLFMKYASPFKAAVDNLPVISQNAADNGSFMAEPDQDGILRRAGMLFSDGQQIYPSLSLSALRIYTLGRKGMARIVEVPPDKQQAIDTPYRITIDKLQIPVESDGRILLYARRFCNEYEAKNPAFMCEREDYISARKILDPEFHEEAGPLIKDKIILIGSSAEGLKDLRSTALQPFRPGVEIHANIIEQALQGKFLLRPELTKAAEALYIVVAGLFFILVSPFVGILVSTALCLTLIAATFFGAYIMYVEHGLLLDPVYPGLSVLTIFVVSTILSYARAEAQRRQIRQAFGMYVAADVLRELESNPGKLKLGGETRDLTVMFTDIRKFTKISEGLHPEQLINLMNEFLTAMTDIVLAQRGTVDKYIGDAMMTFWNAPKEIDGHERHACLTALRMQQALDPVNLKIKEEAQAQKRTPVLLQTGIGIATGQCAVGNMGSKQRFAYSALGDSVNLASRLEGLTKFYGVPIIIAQDTHEKVSDFAALELDLIRVVGKSQAVRIFALIGDPDLAAHGDFGKWAIEHEAMQEKYRAQDFDGALQLIEICKPLDASLGGYLAEYYRMYAARIKDLKTQDLPAGWDAVFEAKEK
ncbi:MAG: adenylate/guanylate cyclase domain-containing protein [Alphaproteobacteria bacterium]|nr:adenylate/guanylate cyclase domain-containing protein [Alphaproteobacteria bacterium]